MLKCCSSHSVSSSSCTLRRKVRALVRNRFFATCCVRVEPPCTTWPAVRSVKAARAMPTGSMPGCAPEAAVLDRHGGRRQIGRHIVQAQRLAHHVAERGEHAAGAILQCQAGTAGRRPAPPRAAAGRGRTTAAAASARTPQMAAMSSRRTSSQRRRGRRATGTLRAPVRGRRMRRDSGRVRGAGHSARAVTRIAAVFGEQLARRVWGCAEWRH